MMVPTSLAADEERKGKCRSEAVGGRARHPVVAGNTRRIHVEESRKNISPSPFIPTPPASE